MTAEIDQYLRDEEEFLQMHWDGAGKEQALEEIRFWTSELDELVATEVYPTFNDIAKRFERKIVEELKRSWSHYVSRFVVEVDDSHIIKTPQSIIEKLIRDWRDTGKPEAPILNRENYKTKLPDSVRLRYVVNFLQDGKELNDFILSEMKRKTSELYRLFELTSKKCNVDERLNIRRKGERSWKLSFVHKQTRYLLEIQICTQLQVAWDKKDHFMIYERKRKGMNPITDIILMKHVSDQLYVVDRQLDELREEILKSLQANETGGDENA